MCGIAGILSWEGKVNTAALDAMTARMAHRGPDGQGIWTSPDQRVGLGHRRLAIIDPTAASSQPMVSPDGLSVVTFNGEIYNYLELRTELTEQGSRFVTQGDVEILLEAYRVWGDACVERFNGMFAFAVWDESRRQLFCARDRFGEKPFLMTTQPDFFAFASEYRALFALAGISDQVNEDRLARFLLRPADGLDRGEQTVFPSIHQLPPGHRMVIDADGTQKIEPYWLGAPDHHPAARTMEQAAEHFRWLLNDSVRLRLRSDVAVGSCLSGGLDSGSIACLVRRQLGADAAYHTFSGRFPGEAADEGEFIDALAQTAHPIRHQVAPDPARLAAELEDFTWANELPTDSTSQYAQYCVFRLAATTGVRVLLDGQGADEILGGYEQYFLSYLNGTDGSDAKAIRARYVGALEQVSPWHSRLPPFVRRMLAETTDRGSDLAFGMNHGPAAFAPPAATLHQALRRDALDGFLGTLLRYGDRNSMAHSVEVRLPFTDHRLFEFVQGLDAHLLMGQAQTKRLLREAMREILPEPVRTRWRKQGFVPPQAAWLSSGLADLLAETVESPTLSSLWRRRWWRRALVRFRAGDYSLASGLWKLLITETWRQTFWNRLGALTRYPAIER